jgi:hypothetical protein
MRDALYITGLLAAVFVLAADFPVGVADVRADAGMRTAFASFVELSPSVHAACLETAKTSWQVRSGSRARPLIGSLDAAVPLLDATIPAGEKDVFADVPVTDSPLGAPPVEVYSLMPESAGADSSRFVARPVRTGDAADEATLPFPKNDMLSLEPFSKLKEMIK